ncbi:aspartic proteinase NANA, chloroplast-like isoform X1 [Zingiber officinale]|uniref:aspartic proteinase NANA, chloroplast-like isoform X1 n=2 Tax=Zingiber officinale TaxID=94328 RepID=UPI001C4B9C49|nr:aspartic proteinase NANA, chloroplast-like isoform X1 [Zingiber officinale]
MQGGELRSFMIREADRSVMPPLLLFFLFCSYGLVAGEMPPESLHLELISRFPHRYLTRLGHLRGLVDGDRFRQRMISQRIGHQQNQQHGRRELAGSNASSAPPAAEESFAMPLSSGAYTGTGQYFVRFLLGTPAQRFVLVVDTGSDLTWVKCRPRSHGGSDAGAGESRVFRPEGSSSYAPIRCSAHMCKSSLPFALRRCPTPETPCAYNYGYSDGSTAKGVFAKESATITLTKGERRRKLRGLVVGCTTSFVGSSFRASDGVLGLGYSPVSFAARAAARFGGRFSYCLVDHLSPKNATSRLTFGLTPALAAPHRRATELLLDPRLLPFYGVRVQGVSINGEMLPIPAGVWDVGRGGGAILDSGTSLTVLAEPAYRLVSSELSRSLSGVPRVSVAPFEHCYNWTAAGPAVSVPKMAIHMSGDVRLEPPAKSYVIDVAEGVKCVGITAAPWPGVSTIGNILQQEHVWEFDLKHRRLRFRRSTCRW